MSKKLKVNELESEGAELSKKVTEPESVLSFDVYFRKLMATKSEIQPHHKLPMKQYAKAKGLETATEKQFDEIFRSY